MFDLNSLHIDSLNEKLFDKIFSKHFPNNPSKMHGINLGIFLPGLIMMKKAQRELFENTNY